MVIKMTEIRKIAEKYEITDNKKDSRDFIQLRYNSKNEICAVRYITKNESIELSLKEFMNISNLLEIKAFENSKVKVNYEIGD